MCPSVWLTLDILAGRNESNSGPTGGVSQHIGNWLDKLKASRNGRANGGSGDEYQNNVHFALELNNNNNNNNSSHVGSAVVMGEPLQLDLNGEGVPVNSKKRKKKRVSKKKAGKGLSAREALEMAEEEVKPLVDCR